MCPEGVCSLGAQSHNMSSCQGRDQGKTVFQTAGLTCSSCDLRCPAVTEVFLL